MGCLWGKRPRSYTESFGPYFPGLWGECYLLNQLHTSHSRPLRSCIVTKTQVKEQRASHMGPRSLTVCLGTWTWPLHAAPPFYPKTEPLSQLDGAQASLEGGYMCTHACAHRYTCTHTQRHTHVYGNTCAHTCTYTDIQTHSHICTQIHICIWKHMHAQTDVYTCIYRDIH